MTFNGSQGDTLVRACIDGRRSPFTHGHLYVALSRVRKSSDLRVLTGEDNVHANGSALLKNIVWPELLMRDKQPQQHALKRPVAVEPGGSIAERRRS